MPEPVQENKVLGRVAMAGAMALFIVNDTIIKLPQVRLPVGELMAVRGLFTIAILLLVAWRMRVIGHVTMIFDRAVLVRAGFDLLTTLLFLTALLHLPIANATAILQAVPFMVIVLAALFLGERTGWRRVVAVIAGFAGVLLVVRPAGDAFNIYSLAAAGAVIAVAGRDIVTRSIGARVPSIIIALANAVAVTSGGAVYGYYQGFAPVSMVQTAWLGLAAVIISCAYLLMVLTIRASTLAATAPYRYSIVLWSILSGYLVFGDLPDTPAFAGIGLIVASGIYALVREAKVAKGPGQG